MTADNTSDSGYDTPSIWEIYKDAWGNDRRWRWQMIISTIVLLALIRFILLQAGVL